MDLRNVEESENVEDLRGQGGGGGGGMMLGGGMGMLVLLLVVWLLGGNPMELLSQMGGQGGGLPIPREQSSGPATTSPREDESFVLVKKVLGNTEEVWKNEFAKYGENYVVPKMRVFSGGVNTGCGAASSAMGPFYCPADQIVYIDLSFFDQMKHELGASGDFAEAYVIAHEVGHHVQKLLGVSDQMNQLRRQLSDVEYNRYSVMLELQADFYAGLWARKGFAALQLDQEDIEEALNAANQIGDDTLQRRAQGRVTPHAFTHGTSEQRKRWFMKGYTTGDIRAGDTFNAKEL